MNEPNTSTGYFHEPDAKIPCTYIYVHVHSSFSPEAQTDLEQNWWKLSSSRSVYLFCLGLTSIKKLKSGHKLKFSNLFQESEWPLRKIQIWLEHVEIWEKQTATNPNSQNRSQTESSIFFYPNTSTCSKKIPISNFNLILKLSVLSMVNIISFKYLDHYCCQFVDSINRFCCV